MENQHGGIGVIAPFVVPNTMQCPMIEKFFINIHHWETSVVVVVVVVVVLLMLLPPPPLPLHLLLLLMMSLPFLLDTPVETVIATN